MGNAQYRLVLEEKRVTKKVLNEPSSRPVTAARLCKDTDGSWEVIMDGEEHVFHDCDWHEILEYVREQILFPRHGRA
ncbi:hypothetical protein GCM10008942_04720 [Rhizomicrobium electricum]|uniref:Uncharacterized protein n=1 Tax=Rhizomicrobium electricum TaxID=480070 RepID=A0ABN1E5R9_9PROT